jgi:hypothetical protein
MLFELFPYTTHVTLIYRHALLKLDGVETTNENPKVIVCACATGNFAISTLLNGVRMRNRKLSNIRPSGAF